MAGAIGDTTKKMSVDLGNVQKTLLLRLWGRAFETKKEKPHSSLDCRMTSFAPAKAQILPAVLAWRG